MYLRIRITENISILKINSGIHRLHLRTGSGDFVSEIKPCPIDDDPKDPQPLNTKFTLLRDETLQLLGDIFHPLKIRY